MRRILKRKTKVFVASLLVLAAALFFIWQNNDLKVSGYEYKSQRVISGLDGFKICQISDLHNKRYGNNQDGIIKVIEKERPDIVVITGDIIDSKRTDIKAALALTKGLKSIAPVYYVTGNHEHRVINLVFDSLVKGLEQSGVIILDNDIREIKYKKESFFLMGLDDRNLSDDTLESLVVKLDKNKLKILLAHEPQYFEKYAEAGVDLVFTGHAHGGQVRIPFAGGLVAPGQGFFPKYTSGMYSFKNTKMLVNRGAGNSVLPVRVFNRPEVVFLTLRSR